MGILAIIVISYLSQDDLQQTTLQQDEKLGLVILTPTVTTTLPELKQVYEQAASTGVGRSNVYLFWDSIEPEKDEYNWEQSDVLMSFNKQNNLQVTLYFSIINGKTLGPFPYWIGKPPIFSLSEDRLVKVLDAILSRYDIIDSLIIGGDTAVQFRYGEQNIESYKKLFTGIYDRLKAQHPNIKIGNSFSLHNVINKNLQHIVTELDVGDFVAFTYFPVDNLNEINKTPHEARADLEKIFELVPNKKVGVFEISWSTSSFVNGNEHDQMKFLSEVYDFYSDNESKFEFFTWYRQYDRPQGTCIMSDLEDVDSAVSVGGSNEFVIERLGEYICSAGLIDVNGNPKLAWEEIKNQIQSNS